MTKSLFIDGYDNFGSDGTEGRCSWLSVGVQ